MDISVKSKRAFLRAIEIVGGQTVMARELSKKLGRPVGQGFVWNQINQNKGPISSEIAIPVEEIIQEKIDGMRRVTRHDLRPDLYP